ncbi:MAG: hypothetical protein LC720_01145 [Actinobacteria bacterium]|nr:hypothetical protein [Actinomycetota bacterium]
MRKLAAIFVLGVAAAVPLVATGGAAGQAVPCPPQSTYTPNAAAVTAAAALSAATSGLGSVGTDGSVKLSFTSSVCGGFRLVLRAKEIRPGNRGFPKHDGYTTLANVLTVIPAGPVTVTFTLTQRGLDLLNYARSVSQSLTVFVIAHVRPRGSNTSSEAIQIVTIT